jgi:glycine cleavage system H protein
MESAMSDIRYTKEHEWVRVEGATATTGISNHAQEQLGDVVFVELPEVGSTLTQGGAMAVVESVKAASDVYAPISGEVVEVNDALEGDPALINGDAEGEGWFCKIEIAEPAEIEDLMDAAAYRAFVASQS